MAFFFEYLGMLALVVGNGDIFLLLYHSSVQCFWPAVTTLVYCVFVRVERIT